MGRFSTTVQIRNNTPRIKFTDLFCEMMKKRGFVPCAADEAALSYLLAFGEGGWVTLTSEEEYKGSPQKAYDDSREMAAALNTSAFTVEVVDSDFAVLTLNNGDTVIVGDGSGYGIEEPARGAPILGTADRGRQNLGAVFRSGGKERGLCRGRAGGFGADSGNGALFHLRGF